MTPLTIPQKTQKPNHHLWFFGLAGALFVVSVLLALGGATLGASLLQVFNAGDAPDLATMGELLGGTLGVAVAFAGAWVAFRIADRANATLSLQQQRESSRGGHETLQKSIGSILAAQLNFEALLRGVVRLASTPERPARQQVWDEEERGEQWQRLERMREEEARVVREHAEQLSQSVQKLLVNPLALSVLFALQKIREPQASPARLLEDLSQLPRLLDHASDTIASGDYRKKEARRGGSVYDWALFLPPETLASLGASDLQLPYYQDLVTTFSFLCFLTGEDQRSPDVCNQEPALWRVLRYFIYDRAQAKAALDEIFPVSIYRDEQIRADLLQSEPVEVFCRSGKINDDQVSRILRDSRRINDLLERIVKHPKASECTRMDFLYARKVSELGRDRALKTVQRQCEKLPKLGSESKTTTHNWDRFYNTWICRHFSWLLAAEWCEISSLQLYQTLSKCHERVLAKCHERVLTGRSDQSAEMVQFFSQVSDLAKRLQARPRVKSQLQALLKGKPKSAPDPDDPSEQDLVEVAGDEFDWVIQEAAEASALDELAALELLPGAAVDRERVSLLLQHKLRDQIMEKLLISASVEQRSSLLRGVAAQPWRLLEIKMAGHACEEEGNADRFNFWLTQQLAGPRERYTRSVLFLAQLRSFGLVARLDKGHPVTAETSPGFVAFCAQIPQVPDFLARSVTFRADANRDKVRLELCIPSFEEAGMPEVWNKQDKLLEMLLVLALLGYEKDDPSKPFVGWWSKEVGYALASSEWLRVVLLELKLVGSIYTTLAEQGKAPSSAEVHAL